MTRSSTGCGVSQRKSEKVEGKKRGKEGTRNSKKRINDDIVQQRNK